MSQSRMAAAALAIAVMLLAGRAAANEPCGYADLTGEPFGACAPGGRGAIPGTLDDLLHALDGRLPTVLRDRCTEGGESICDCALQREIEECWSFEATRTPLVKWFSDQGVATTQGIAELSILWLKRRIHRQDLRIDEAIARYLAANKKREARYNQGVGSGSRGWPLGPRDDPGGFLQLDLGEGVPRYERFLFYMVEHAERQLVDCWRMLPQRGTRIEVSMRLFPMAETSRWTARIERSSLPPEHGACMASAISGVRLPGFGPGPYELAISGSREQRTAIDEPGLPRDSLYRLGPWVALPIVVAAAVLVWRRLRRRRARNG